METFSLFLVSRNLVSSNSPASFFCRELLFCAASLWNVREDTAEVTCSQCDLCACAKRRQNKVTISCGLVTVCPTSFKCETPVSQGYYFINATGTHSTVCACSDLPYPPPLFSCTYFLLHLPLRFAATRVFLYPCLSCADQLSASGNLF